MAKNAFKSPFFLFSHLLRNICQIAKFCHRRTKHCMVGAWIAIIGLGHEARWSHQSTQIIIGCMSFMQNYSPKHGSKHDLPSLYFFNADMWWGCPCFSPHLGFRPKHGLEKGLTLEKKATNTGWPDTLNHKMSNPCQNLARISHCIARACYQP